jgi:hypothetical protein
VWDTPLQLTTPETDSGLTGEPGPTDYVWNVKLACRKDTVYGGAGQPTEGLRTLAAAIAVMYQHGLYGFEANLHWRKGELLLAQLPGSAPEAETCFQQALDVARRQEAKLLELRAAMSLARLWHQQGKRQKAHDLLAPVYGWFTEGFDTADLQEAKSLLDTLA